MNLNPRFTLALGSGVSTSWTLAHNMRVISSVAVLFVVGLQGCVPLPQMEPYPSRIPFSANYDHGNRYVSFSIGSENQPKDYQIVAQRSYVISPSGERHPIRVEPHAYDISQRHPFIRDDIFVLRSDEDSKPMLLHNGTWKFVLSCRRSDTVRQDEFSFRIWTFNYNPVLHGPPN